MASALIHSRAAVVIHAAMQASKASLFDRDCSCLIVAGPAMSQLLAEAARIEVANFVPMLGDCPVKQSQTQKTFIG